MNYRGLIFSLLGLVGIITGIVFAVRAIKHKDDPQEVMGVERTLEECNFPLFKAVPSDAAAIASFDGGSDASYYLTDSTSVFPTLFGGNTARFLKKMTARKMAVSFHDTGGLTPLAVLDLSDADSAGVASAIHLADTLRLSHRYVPERALFLVSPSETLTGSSERHLSGGFSVLDNQELRSVSAVLPYGNALFLSHAASSRLIRTFLTKKYYSDASFMSKVAVWTGFSLPKRGEKRLEGVSEVFGTTYYQYILSGMVPGEFKFRDIVPAEACNVLALASDDIEGYFPLRRKWLDASGRLSAYKDANKSARQPLGMVADEYAVTHKLKEAVSVLLPSGDRLVGLRYKDCRREGSGLNEYKAAYALSMLFGDSFRPQGDSLWSVIRGNWKWIGSRSALSSISEHTLKESSDASALAPERGVFAMYDAGWVPSEVMSSAYVKPVRTGFNGASRIAMSLTVLPFEEGVRYEVSFAPASYTPPVTASAATSASSTPRKDSPSMTEFQVKNCRTGKMNTLFQKLDGTIGLRSETGSVLWTVPFSRPIASKVQEIDYYGNQKVQFLFGAGSRLYIIDVMGHILPSYNVDLGREILLGPEVYSFNGKDYALMVLHKDNTLSLYTLEGAKYPGWKDISSKERVSALPELLVVEGERYWKVGTVSGDVYYNFEGGSSLSGRQTKNLLEKIVLKSE